MTTAITIEKLPISPAAPAIRPELRNGIYVERWDALAGKERDFWISEWERLFYLDPEARGFQHPRFVKAEVQGLQQALPVMLVATFVNNELQQLAVMLPKVVTTNKLTGLKFGWSLAGYRLAGNRILCRDGKGQVSEELLLTIKAQVRVRGGHFLLIEDLDERSALHHQLGMVPGQPAANSAASVICPTEFQPRQRIVMPAQPQDYWSQFSSKTRSTFRRKLKKFGNNSLLRITSRAELPAFLLAAHEISKQTWQTRQFGLRVRNDQREMDELGALADLGFLRCYLWRVEGLPAAFLIGNQAQGTYHYEEVGYMSHLARFSPGQMLLLQVLDDLLAHDTPLQFDFGGGDAEYKQLFANDTSNSGTIWWVAPAMKAKATFQFIRACGTAKRAVRSLVRTAGLGTRVRQWIRYGKTSGDAAPANIAPDTAAPAP